MGKKKKLNISELVNALTEEELEKLHMDHTEARNAFTIKRAKVEDYDDILDDAAEYLQYHHETVYGSKIKESLLKGKLTQILDAVFNQQGGHKYAVELARKGKMHEVFDAIKQYHVHTDVQARKADILTAVDPEDYDTKLEVIREIKKGYKGALDMIKDKNGKPKYKDTAEGLLVERWKEVLDDFAKYVGQAKKTFKQENKEASN